MGVQRYRPERTGRRARGAARALTLALAGTAAGTGAAQEVVLDPPAPEIVAAAAGDVVRTGEIVVLVADAAAGARLTAAAAPAGYALTREDVLSGLGLVLLTYAMPPGRTGAEAIAELEALEPGATAGLNHAYRPQPDAAKRGARVYAGAAIGWPDAGCPARARIGVLDTALGPAGSAVPGAARITEADFAAPGSGGEHGAEIAALLAGPGRLTGAEIFHAAVVGPVEGRDPAAGVDAMLRALDWLEREGVRIVNVSLAGPYNKLLDRAVQEGARRGMVLVAAAGNDGPEGPPLYPAALRQTIAVTAVDAALAPYRGAPEGERIDIAAPGVDVYVETGDGAGRYRTGTSVAAPFVTAAIAADPALAALGDAAAIRAALAERARDLGEPGRDPVFGAGLVQAPEGCLVPG